MKERKFSFNNFAIGRANQLAYLSIKRTLKNLGRDINPLFIYSDNGLGKTHLMYAVKEVLKGENVQFLDGVGIKSIPDKEGSVLIFENIHLLLDDIKEGADLYNLVKSYISAEKQVYITSLSPPENLALTEQLTSLIKEGLTVPIFQPDSELVGRIFKMLSGDFEIKLKEDVIQFLSTLPFNDIREIETVIKKIDLLKDVTKEITIEAVRDNIGLEEIISSEDNATSVLKRDFEFYDFLKDIREDFGKVSLRQKSMKTMKEEYREKLYIWKMKGFDVKRLENAMNGPIDGIMQAFVSFTSDIQRLIEMQKRYGELEKMATPQEREYLEKALFNPDAILDIDRKLIEIEERKRLNEEYNKFLDVTPSCKNFVILPSNRDAFEVLRKGLSKRIGVKLPIYIYGSYGCGKTHLLMAFTKKMRSVFPEKVICYMPSRFLTFEIKNLFDEKAKARYIKKIKRIDALFLDDIEDLHNDGESFFLRILDDFAKKGKILVVSSTLPPEKLGLGRGAEETFLFGTVSYIKPIEEKDRKVVITNLFARKKVLLSDEIRTFLGKNLTGRFNEIKKGVEKIITKIVEENLELTMANVADVIGIKKPAFIKEKKFEGKTKRDETVSQAPTGKKILPSEFDYRWPSLKERIFDNHIL